MKITCDSCQSKYTISDEKVQGKTVKIKCRKCGATLVVTSAGVTTNGATGAGGAGAGVATSAGGGDGSWLVNVADGDQRTMSLADVVTAYNAGVIDQETYLWSDGMEDWQPLAQVPTIVEALHASSANAGATAPQAALDAGSLFDPTPMSPPVAAAAQQQEQQEEKRAAIVRRDGRRGTQDLFGAQTGGEMVTSAPNAFDGGPALMSGGGAEAHGAAQGATGQRNENSVLFSLAALTKNDAPAPSASAGSAKKDDSGLIDLKALAASAGAASGVPQSSAFGNPLSPLTPFAAPLAPIGLDVLSAPVGSMPPPAAASKNKALIFVAAGTLVALVAIFGVFFALRGGDKTPPAASTTATAAPTETVATAEPTASAPPADTATATASATASAPVAAKGKTPPPGYKPPAPGQKPPTATPGAPTPPPAAPTAKPPAATGKCGCSPNDLMCQMKCAAGK